MQPSIMLRNVPARAMNYALKISDRAKNMFFFSNILGMKILRHEQFERECEPDCNCAYNNCWTKAMFGYGPETSHFAVELNYKNGFDSCKMGTDFGGMTIQSKDILRRAFVHNYPVKHYGNFSVLSSPDGYKFHVFEDKRSNANQSITKIVLHSSNLASSKTYWHDLLGMNIVGEEPCSISLSYGSNQPSLLLREVPMSPMNSESASGRITFTVPKQSQMKILNIMKTANCTILKPFFLLRTPGKSSVWLTLLADPDGNEVCFADKHRFLMLLQMRQQTHFRRKFSSLRN